MPQVLDPPAEHKPLRSGDSLGPQRRVLQLRADDAPVVDTDARTVELSFSSETPVERWWGREILSHAAGCADLARINAGGNLLWGHDPDDVLGVVERAWIGDDKRGHALVRFGKDERGEWAMQQVLDKIIRNVSFMYTADDYVCEVEDPDRYSADDTYTARRWCVYEISLLSIPADYSVGVGRSAEPPQSRVHVDVRVRGAPEAAPPAGSAGDRTDETPPANPASNSRGEEPMIPSRFRTTRLHNAVLDAHGSHAGGGNPTGTPPQDAMAAERQRAADIVALCRTHNLPMETTHSMIERGLSIGDARGEVLNHLQRVNPQSPTVSLRHDPNPDMEEGEKKRYSYLRALQAAMTGDWSKAGFERTVSEEIGKRNGKGATGKGFFMPSNLPFAPSEEHLRAWRMLGKNAQLRATYQVGTPATGGNLVATQLLTDQWIEVLRNQLVTARLGARYLTGLEGNIDIPRQISQTQTYWVGESGAPTESEATFDKVQLRPKTIGALSKMSRLMMMQATPAIEMLAREDLLAVMAQGIDVSALSAPGTGNQPTGIVNQSGVASVIGGTNGANLTFDHIIQMIYATRFANAPQGSTGFALNSKAIGYLSTLKSTTGQYLWDSQGGLTNDSPDKLRGRYYAESQQLRSNLTKGTAAGICSELIYGDWQELLIASWGITEIVVNPFGSVSDFASGDVWIRALQTMDVGVRHGASFAVMSDALTPGF